ncbi:MAG: sigma-70 family RNA polymerase sigma factor [Opitutaceae bacterium]
MKDPAALLRLYHRDGSQDAFAEIVAQHIDVVYSVALRKTASPTLAEDVTQLVFTDLARKARTLSEHPALAGWLFKSAHFAAANLLRAERRHHHHVQRSHLMQSPLHEAPTPPVDWEALRPVLDDAINELSDHEREAVVLRFFHGIDFAALGAQFNLSADGARSRVERAVEKLHASLTRRGITSTSSALAIALGSHAATAAPVGMAGAVTAAVLADTATKAAMAGFAPWLKTPVAIAALLLLAAAGVYVSVRHRERRGGEMKSDAVAHAVNNAKPAVGVSSEARTEPAVAVPKALVNGASMTDLELAAGDAFLAKYPEIRAVLARSQRASWASRYFPLYLELGLDEATSTRLEEILASNGATTRFPEGFGEPGSPSMRLRAFPPIEKAERERQIRELLGEEGYQRFKSHSISGTDQAMKFASALSSSATPLTAEQGRTLARIFETTSTTSPRSAESWRQLLTEAQMTLSPAQMFPLEALRASEDLAAARRAWAQKDNALSADRSRPSISLAAQLNQDANIPEIQLLSLAVKRAQFSEDYGPLLQSRGLPPETTARLTEAFISREALAADLAAVARARQARRDDPELTAIRTNGEDQFGAIVIELLGPEALTEWREYERSLPARRYVQQLAGVAAVSGIPISQIQAEQLTTAIARANSGYARGGKIDWGRQDWTAVDLGAEKILSPVQLRLAQSADPDGRRWDGNLLKMVTSAGSPATYSPR